MWLRGHGPGVTILDLKDGCSADLEIDWDGWTLPRDPEPRAGVETIDRDDEPGFAGWALGGPLTAALALVGLVQLATWIPHYLTWPYWADHDVFATAARAWDRGDRPYRDIRLNNFPGTIYLFWALGKLGGWGKAAYLHAFDAGLVLTLIGAMLIWSRRRFGRFLPAMVGMIAFLSYYLSLDYSHAAQRDWHASCLAMLGLLVAQASNGRRGGRIVSALLTALGLSIRPQVVVFLPALLLASVAAGRADEERRSGRSAWRGVEWVAFLAVFTALAFAPLAIAGVLGDFTRSLKLVAFGSEYNRVNPTSLVKAWIVQASEVRWLVVPAGILLLAGRGRPGTWATARAWLLAMAGASFYKPISPMAHSYLDLPLVLVWSINLSVLAAFASEASGASARFRLAAVIGLLGMGTTTLHPQSCAVGPCLQAYAVLRSGSEPEGQPPGYRKGSVATSAYYPWEAYRGVLDYLRRKTGPTTRVANVLKGDPAITSVVDRPSAFPAESVAWLRMVDGRDEGEFVESLRKAEDSVVLWSPDEEGPNPMFRVDEIEAEIRKLYDFEEVFGPIQVWRRKPAVKP